MNRRSAAVRGIMLAVFTLGVFSIDYFGFVAETVKPEETAAPVLPDRAGAIRAAFATAPESIRCMDGNVSLSVNERWVIEGDVLVDTDADRAATMIPVDRCRVVEENAK